MTTPKSDEVCREQLQNAALFRTLADVGYAYALSLNLHITREQSNYIARSTVYWIHELHEENRETMPRLALVKNDDPGEER